MRRDGSRSRWVVVVCVAAAVVLSGGVVSSGALASQASRLSAGDPHGLVPVRGAGHRGGGSPLLLWHSAEIMPTAAVHAIYWGTSWPGDATDKVSGLDSFYQGVGGSGYAHSNTEYSGTNGQVSSTISYTGHTIDGTAGPTKPPSTTTVLAEVAKVIGSAAVHNGYYPVYTDLPRGHAGYCAWHSSGTVPNGTLVQFAFFFKLDGDPGCDPQDTSGLHSEGLAALANVSGHELSEALTDPDNGGWYDSSGAENADKCAWTFGHPLLTLSNTSQWKVQGNWSNTAYSANTGYPNSSGQNGCIDN
jgi:hypothetical protein